MSCTIGLISNPRLEELAKLLLEERAKRESEAREGEKVRLVGSALYRAGSWEHARRVVYKAEVLEKGTNTRFFANQFRLLLHAAAYRLMDTLRTKLVARRVRRLLTKVRLYLALGHPGQRLWNALAPRPVTVS